MAQLKPRLPDPATVICNVLAETISAGALTWEGGGSRTLLLQWMANQCLASLHDKGYHIGRKK
jgi:hypothetical protein